MLMLINCWLIYKIKTTHRHNEALQTQVNDLIRLQDEDRQTMNQMKQSNVNLQKSVNQLIKQIKKKEQNILKNTNFDKLTQRDTINEI